MKKNESGQSLVEAVVAVAVVMLTMTGIIVLMVFSSSGATELAKRQKAGRLGREVMEDLIKLKKNDPEEFWKQTNQLAVTKEGYDGYVYSIGFTNVNNGVGCSQGYSDCAQVVVNVGWSGKGDPVMTINRFFSNNE